MAQGRAFLWEGAPERPTPEFPYEKARDFPLERLRRGHAGRTVESSRRAAIVRWHDETNGGRRKLLAGIQRGNAKRSQWAKDCYHDPERGQATRDNLRQGPEARRKKKIQHMSA